MSVVRLLLLRKRTVVAAHTDGGACARSVMYLPTTATLVPCTQVG